MFKKSFLKNIAKKEKVSLSFLEKQLKDKKAVIPLNNQKELKNPVVIGDGFKVKINTNIGISSEKPDISGEIKKLKEAIRCGSDTVMDLSIGKNPSLLRKQIIKKSIIPLGTVPIYEAAVNAEKKNGSFEQMPFDCIWETLKKQAQEGVDFFTIHSGILKNSIEHLKNNKRTGGIVSRGGAILARWMLVNEQENPLYMNFDKILNLAKKYNISISLGDALRPGAISDSTDNLQISELQVLGELVKKCWRKGVQVMVEGPGHIPLNEIETNIKLEKKICYGAPFYVLGPLPTDIAAGYDHISSAIGGTIAAYYGANFLCVVTPAEHLRHPDINDIREGVIASKIAAHSVDLLNFKDEWEKNKKISDYRAQRKWQKTFPLTLDQKKAKSYHKKIKPSDDICTMCGKFCSLKIVDKCDLLQ
ncbi:MAG: phosphomethylpyrimidine synthase ThiC [Candidatus Omnitrophica bacterium]|nr:phosphomethylpyrimidine synthase ThiC [Candidatus Omnitrophota bacterium]MCF7878080.1 phosphomethylpyrimidine synthase ThiC [Candidatus Omnitrophota bacterium]